jgi:cobalt-zinc-cadmium efflux system outer membrane protein
MRLLLLAGAVFALLTGNIYGESLSWQQVLDAFHRANPTIQANQLNEDESRAEEITAFLRPNPDLTVSADGTQIAPNHGVWQPFAGTLVTTAVSYLHERQHKRELRLEAAQGSTAVTISTTADEERALILTLRLAFVQMLQAKAVLQNARENLDYWDKEMTIARTRLEAGGMSQMDFNRQALQRVQFESDAETAMVNLRTAKIQLLMLLNQRTPVEDFDVTGPYDFPDSVPSVDKMQSMALDARPDLKAAKQNVQLASVNHQLAVANGSTDPTYSLWYTNNASFNNPFATNTLGASFSIPLRFFDRNQGEKARTQIDIRRNERLRDATEAQVISDVSTAHANLASALTLLQSYKTKYLLLAIEVRDTVAFAYGHGSTSLLDYLDAEKSYRDTRLTYLNLIAAYLNAAAQLNSAVGREVIQ